MREWWIDAKYWFWLYVNDVTGAWDMFRAYRRSSIRYFRERK